MGSLRIYIQVMDKQNNRKQIWEKNGNQGMPWHHSDVTITSSSPFKVSASRLWRVNCHDKI